MSVSELQIYIVIRISPILVLLQFTAHIREQMSGPDLHVSTYVFTLKFLALKKLVLTP